MNCVFPLIKDALDNGNITVDDLAKAAGGDVTSVESKLCGKDKFIINEAMAINLELFPEVPFKALFSPLV